jgi:tryptophan-rich sensory protein
MVTTNLFVLQQWSVLPIWDIQQGTESQKNEMFIYIALAILFQPFIKIAWVEQFGI